MLAGMKSPDLAIAIAMPRHIPTQLFGKISSSELKEFRVDINVAMNPHGPSTGPEWHAWFPVHFLPVWSH